MKARGCALPPGCALPYGLEGRGAGLGTTEHWEKAALFWHMAISAWISNCMAPSASCCLVNSPLRTRNFPVVTHPLSVSHRPRPLAVSPHQPSVTTACSPLGVLYTNWAVSRSRSKLTSTATGH